MVDAKQIFKIGTVHRGNVRRGDAATCVMAHYF